MHTGDIGFFDEAGWFYLVDRKKDMISASGFKVWPREVEDVLYAFPGIREAAVIGSSRRLSRRDRPGFCVGSTNAEINVTALSGHCRKQLAAYKCPTEIRVVPDLPKTITGRIRRNALTGDIHSR
jgi:long-chain acyl-CoA synthetase